MEYRRETARGPLAIRPIRAEDAPAFRDLRLDAFKRHPGIFLVTSGHVLGKGEGLLTSKGDQGNTVHQVLVNYQMLREGGLGYLRLFEILPDGKTLRMKTYSPSLGLYAVGKEHAGDLVVEPGLW